MSRDLRQLDAPVVENVIQMLEHMRKCPGMWLGGVHLANAEHFLMGVTYGLAAGFNLRPLNECESQVCHERGYRYPFHSPHELPDQLRERFPNEHEAVVEYIAIKLDTWKRLHANLSLPTS